MNRKVLIACLAALGAALAIPARALPVAPLDSGPAYVTQVRAGCGFGRHRGYYGHCRMNRHHRRHFRHYRHYRYY
jgi:hypothetical protein